MLVITRPAGAHEGRFSDPFEPAPGSELTAIYRVTNGKTITTPPFRRGFFCLTALLVRRSRPLRWWLAQRSLDPTTCRISSARMTPRRYPMQSLVHPGTLALLGGPRAIESDPSKDRESHHRPRLLAHPQAPQDPLSRFAPFEHRRHHQIRAAHHISAGEHLRVRCLERRLVPS